MTITCPQCRESERLSTLRRPYRFTFGQLVLGLLGGMIGGIFWVLGQEGKFKCGQCSHIFYSHTTLSRVFCVLCLLIYSVVAVGICYGLWTAFISPP